MVFQFMVFLTVSNLRSGCVVPEVCLVGYTPYKTRKIIPALWGKFPSRFSAKHVGGGTAHATGMVAFVNIYLVKRPFHRHTVRRLFALSGCPIVEENLLGKSVRCRENQLGKSVRFVEKISLDIHPLSRNQLGNTFVVEKISWEVRPLSRKSAWKIGVESAFSAYAPTHA